MSTLDLWPHQQRVFDLLTAGENVILQAPTGSGKTRAALYPFLVAQDDQSGHHSRFPHKCIYSVPMRVLAKQFRIEYEKTVQRYNPCMPPA
jgi:CRISPR-associated endonuclease/helicase Cas3